MVDRPARLAIAGTLLHHRSVVAEKAQEVTTAMVDVPGIVNLKLFRTLGQPNLELTVERREAARSA